MTGEQTTHTIVKEFREPKPLARKDCLALAVIWCAFEPERIGEVLLFRSELNGKACVFGRESMDVHGSEVRVHLCRQRPGDTSESRPLHDLCIGRRQLRVVPNGLESLHVQDVGRCKMWVNEGQRREAQIKPGDVLELDERLAFLCIVRPNLLLEFPGTISKPFRFGFGLADGCGIVGESEAAWELRRHIWSFASSPEHVLLLGATGSGKELATRAIHRLSSRGSRPLVAWNIAAVTEGMIDAELFGHPANLSCAGQPEEKGAVGDADGTTLFLDEIGDMPLGLQARLLRFVETGEYRRVKESRARRSDARIIAATCRPESSLRPDLRGRFLLRYSLEGLDPCREDIPLLLNHFIRSFARTDAYGARRFFPEGNPDGWPVLSPMFVAHMVQRQYEEGTRELKRLLIDALQTSEGDWVDIPPGWRERSAVRSFDSLDSDTSSSGRGTRWQSEPPPQFSWPEGILTNEDEQHLALFARCGFNMTEAAKDSSGPGVRTTCDKAMKVLTCKALAASSWNERAAAQLLAGDIPPLVGRMRKRISKMLDNMRLDVVTIGEESLRKRYERDFRQATRWPCAVLDAIRKKEI